MDNARRLRRRRRLRRSKGVSRSPRPGFDARAGVAPGRDATSADRTGQGNPDLGADPALMCMHTAHTKYCYNYYYGLYLYTTADTGPVHSVAESVLVDRCKPGSYHSL